MFNRRKNTQTRWHMDYQCCNCTKIFPIKLFQCSNCGAYNTVIERLKPCRCFGPCSRAIMCVNSIQHILLVSIASFYSNVHFNSRLQILQEYFHQLLATIDSWNMETEQSLPQTTTRPNAEYDFKNCQFINKQQRNNKNNVSNHFHRYFFIFSNF